MTSAISLPGSEFGGTAFAALGGLTIAEFGAGLAPANLSARQAAALDLLTSGICGPRGTTSSRSAALQESLANRLRAKTGSNGSILYRLTWKTRGTPSGRQICALRGSPNKAATVADFICGNASISSQPVKGWTTPQAHDVSGRSKTQKAAHGTKHGCACLVNEALATGWQTPRANDAEKRGANIDPNDPRNGIVGQAMAAGWAAPLTNAIKDTGDLEGYLHGPNGRFRNDSTTTQAVLAGWPTPNVPSGGRKLSFEAILSGKRENGAKAQIAVHNVAEQLCPLPNAPNDSTAFLIMTPDGQTQVSFIAATGGGVQLNPAHSRWLMRFPVQWEQCAPSYETYALLQALASAT